MRMSTSSMPISGSGTSSSQRPGSTWLLTSACIVFCPGKKLGESGKQERTKSAVRDQKMKLAELSCVMLRTKLFSIGMMENHARDARTSRTENRHAACGFYSEIHQHD